MPASSSASSPAPTFGVVALLPSDGRLLSGSDHAFLFAGNQLYRIDARGILQDVSLFRGLPPSYHEHYRTNAFFGSFPDAFWVQIGGSSRKPETYRWAAGRWGRVYPLDEGEALLSVVLIGKKRAVGLVTGEQGRLRLIRGNDQSNPPSPLTEIAAPPSSASASVLPSAEPPASAAPLLPAEAPSASASALASASASGAPPAPSASAPAAVERRPSRLRNGTLQQRLKEQTKP